MAPNIPGDLLIYIGFAFNILVGIFFLFLAQGKTTYENLALKSYHLFTAVITLATCYLIYLFFENTFVVAYVYNYSDKSLPFFYKLSALWGGQEGTYLLWLMMNAFFGYIIIKKGGVYRNVGMVVYSIVNLFFLFLLVKLSPFALLNGYPPDGAGLNPLLQNPWMVVHPPVIFIGYSLSAVPFSFAMAALILNDFSSWVKRAFPWAAITALMLAGGNILGGYWAYITLGWGGFWAWDPVENSSFIPWFIAIAFIHGLLIEKRTGALRKSNILMASFVFILVIYGTFLTRSGVLADFSVHSFVDLGINQYLVLFLVLYILMALMFFVKNKINYIIATLLFVAFAITTFVTGGNQYVGVLITIYAFANLIIFIPQQHYISNIPITFNIFNKEFITFCGMAILFVFPVIVLFWTSLPILTNIFTDNPHAANMSTYNTFAVPFAIIYALLLTVAPITAFQNRTIEKWHAKLGIITAFALAIGFGLFYFILGSTLMFAAIFSVVTISLAMYMLNGEFFKELFIPLLLALLTVVFSQYVGVENKMYMLFFAVAVMMTASNLISMLRNISSWKTIGAQISHVGFGLMIIGVLASSAFTTNKKLVIPRGGSDDAYGLSVSYLGMEHNFDYPQNKLILKYTENGKEYNADPQLYFSQKLQGIMKRPFVDKYLLYDLYFSPEQIKQSDGDGNAMVLTKNEPFELEGYQFTFIRYEMTRDGGNGSHSSMSAVAYIDVSKNGKVVQITPTITLKSHGDEKETETINKPASFGENNKYVASIDQILDNQNAVSLNIPGLTFTGPPDRLILDISKKPIINFVWLGTTLILLGAIVVYFRRKDEMV